MKLTLRQWDGPLTRLLVQQPGGFGLGQLPRQLTPDGVTTSVCGYCSTGCGLDVLLKDGRAVGVKPSAEYPVNLGMACPKGWEALSVLNSPDRATTPLLRNNSGKLAPVSWDIALSTFVEKFKSIQQRHGPEALAWLGTGQIVTEEMALLGALAKFGMGIVHGDGNTRQCMATAVTAYKQSFGFDAPPYTYADLEESDVIVLVGSNLCITHPIMWERICRNQNRPHIIVIDPRRTETAMAAESISNRPQAGDRSAVGPRGRDTHLPLRPKSDLVLLYGLAHLLLREGWIDRTFIDAHTSGFGAFAEHVKSFDPTPWGSTVAERSGIDADTLLRVARAIGQGQRVSFWWTMGVNQSHEGVRVAQAIINLALMTGNIGRPGTGANSITGQCNAMGSRLFSNTTNLLGGRDFQNAEHRNQVAGILGIDAGRIPGRASLAYDQIVDGVASGRIKGLWVIGTNPSHSWIGQNDFNRMLDKLEFLVVQEMYHTTETAARAHLVLPAAAWGEKEGTFINSERRIGLVRKVARAPGQALDDFAIFKLIAHYWGCAEMFRQWESPAAVFQILKRLSRGRPCDITGITDYQMIDQCGGIQWPYRKEETEESAPPLAPPATHRRLFADGRFFHEDGRAQFHLAEPRRMPESPDRAYPFLLLTGRGSSAQWHTQTRTRNSPVLRKLHPPGIYVEVSPEDARRLGFRPNQLVAVESRRGHLRARAFITHCVQSGQVFIPMHYHAVNRLTDPVFDPHSRQPSYKACAVRLRALLHWESEA
ncbi:MAG TPA: nitrate reductase [Tepidisphaeraceae bacterium]|jgi:assimilatory nitrate reductase catalytic subunit